MAQARYQPQGLARLDRRNKFATNAQAILLASQNVNLATSKALTIAGSGYVKQGFPAGVAWSFRKNFYLESEALPAIGTASYVEFWYGYPSSDLYARGDSSAPALLTGQSTNQLGIVGSVGTNSSNSGTTNSAYWGAVYNWPTLNNAGEALTPGRLTLLMVVRRQSGVEFWRDGRVVRFISQSPTDCPAGAMICGSFVQNTDFWTSSSDTLLAGRVLTPVEPTAEEIRQFSANPWKIFLDASGDEYVVPVAGNAYTLTAGSGAFAFATAALRLSAARRLPADPGALALAGSAARLLAQRRLPGAAGAFLAAAASAGLLASRRLGVAAGAFAHAGRPVKLAAARRLAADVGTFAFAAGGAQMTYLPAPGPGGPTYTLTLASGAFGLAGAAAALQVRRKMAAATGMLVLAGSPAALVARRRLAAAVGGYALQGVAVQVRTARRIPAQAGMFALAGAAAVLKYTSSGQRFDISKIHPSRIVIFDGSGSRVTPFDGTGSRVTRFE